MTLFDYYKLFCKEHLILLVVPEEKNIGLQPYLILFLFLYF